MNNNGKQYLTLAIVLGLALALGVIKVCLQIQDAHIKSIQTTVEQQFNEVEGE